VRPAIVAVDEDPGALRDVERELRDRYAGHYRVMCAAASHEGRTCLTQLAVAGEEVALVLVGQCLSGMTGTELLDRARQLHPNARRGLLIERGSVGDGRTSDAIFDSLDDGRIDTCLLKPSALPDQHFHQAISSLLLAWADEQRTHGNTHHQVRVA
jgi:thioredoxin reductase (NADPH)